MEDWGAASVPEELARVQAELDRMDEEEAEANPDEHFIDQVEQHSWVRKAREAAAQRSRERARLGREGRLPARRKKGAKNKEKTSGKGASDDDTNLQGGAKSSTADEGNKVDMALLRARVRSCTGTQGVLEALEKVPGSEADAHAVILARAGELASSSRDSPEGPWATFSRHPTLTKSIRAVSEGAHGITKGNLVDALVAVATLPVHSQGATEGCEAMAAELARRRPVSRNEAARAMAALERARIHSPQLCEAVSEAGNNEHGWLEKASCRDVASLARASAIIGGWDGVSFALRRWLSERQGSLGESPVSGRPLFDVPTKDVCQLLWAFACREEHSHPLALALWREVAAKRPGGQVELTQLHHAALACLLDTGEAPTLPKTLTQRAREAWEEGSQAEARPSALAEAVVAACTRLGLPVEREKSLHGLIVDAALESKRVAIEVDGPVHYFANDARRPTCRSLFKRRCVLRSGWNLAVIPHWELDDGQAPPERMSWAVQERLRQPLAASEPGGPLPELLPS